MKKLFALTLFLTFLLPALCLAQDFATARPIIGVIRVGDEALFNDEEIVCMIDEKTAALFETETYQYLPFTELEPSFTAFLASNDVQNTSELTDELLHKFAKEQDLDYLLFTEYKIDELQYDRVFFKSTYRVMLGTDLKFLDADESEVLYANHLIADGNSNDESTAYRKSVKKMMRRIKAHFNVDAVLE